MKVAIYCRLSEEDRNKQFETDDSNSIQNQKSMLLQYAMEQGWELYNIYSDDDYTGSDRRRPEFNRLLKDAEQHRFDIIPQGEVIPVSFLSCMVQWVEFFVV